MDIYTLRMGELARNTEFMQQTWTEILDVIAKDDASLRGILEKTP